MKTFKLISIISLSILATACGTNHPNPEAIPGTPIQQAPVGDASVTVNFQSSLPGGVTASASSQHASTPEIEVELKFCIMNIYLYKKGESQPYSHHVNALYRNSGWGLGFYRELSQARNHISEDLVSNDIKIPMGDYEAIEFTTQPNCRIDGVEYLYTMGYFVQDSNQSSQALSFLTHNNFRPRFEFDFTVTENDQEISIPTKKMVDFIIENHGNSNLINMINQRSF